jgi:hypothetical protein
LSKQQLSAIGTLIDADFVSGALIPIVSHIDNEATHVSAPQAQRMGPDGLQSAYATAPRDGALT